ncbi:hypothetical protein BRM3_01995 [Brachybacterium huguangmaarense]|uniref:DNA-directed RNA polymerase subunit beta n=2 Tax=Brachybacterium huguangmaarense TaxID=1652028 RepID=A0ABY6G2A1_9MICO|nr:hypothetical protein BRM3_01995 [Brachybacterium huguangmaarense]
MKMSTPRFRRPASLSLADQDLLPGEPDPATSTDLAHRSAEALVAQVRQSADDEVVRRVVALAQTEGLDDLAALWSTSPAGTLPGALWRLYVLHAWVQRDPEDVVRRYREGSRTVPGLRYLAGLSEPPDVPSVRRTLDQILRGAFTGDLAMALGRAAAVLMLVSYGTAHLADAEPDPRRQGELTGEAGRLLSTGEELAVAARLEEAGDLS